MNVELGQITVLQIFQALALGTVLGVAYFGGLKLTLNRIESTKHPAVVVFLSYILRLLLIFTGLFLLYRIAGLTGLLLGAVTALCMMFPFMLLNNEKEGQSS